MVEELLRAGADPAVANNLGATAMNKADEYNRTAVAKALAMWGKATVSSMFGKVLSEVAFPHIASALATAIQLYSSHRILLSLGSD
eukprot:SAG31_NODE_6186_length_2132_cov_1.652238_4_plen_86_part_00